MYNLHPNNQVLVRNATSCYSSSSLCSMFSLLFSSRSKYLAETNSVVLLQLGMMILTQMIVTSLVPAGCLCLCWQRCIKTNLMTATFTHLTHCCQYQVELMLQFRFFCTFLHKARNHINVCTIIMYQCPTTLIQTDMGSIKQTQ